MKVQWGGGILESKRKNPKNLQRFIKNKKQKRIVIGSIVGIVLIIGGITLYRTFAMYKVEKSFDVLNGIVPPFMNGDLQLAVTVDGKKQETIPTTSDKNYGVVVACENAKGSWDKENWRAILEDFNGSKVKCNLYFESTLSGYIKALAKVDASIIEEEHDATAQTPVQTDYRYVGKDPNNYVCLEENGSCSEDKLYRIIGVMPTQKEEDTNSEYEDRVKLINLNYDVYKPWNENENNNWLDSQVYQYLNNDYWKSIQSYQHYIENAKWYLGAVGNRSTARTFYIGERGNVGALSSPETIKTISKIGLLYPSDYSYATNGGDNISRENCIKSITGDEVWTQGDNDCRNNDWLYINNQNYWTLTSRTIEREVALIVHVQGYLSWAGIRSTSTFRIAIKPAFYLKKDVLYKSGDGSKGNPYRIAI